MMHSREFIRLLYEKYGSDSDTTPDRHPSHSADLLDGILGSGSVPVAIFHSRALGRDFALASDIPALESMGESDRRVPLLTYAECEKLAGLSAADLNAVLDVREIFGPTAQIVAARSYVG